MFDVHILNEAHEVRLQALLEAVPPEGSLVRLKDGSQWRVKRAIWRLDELSDLGQRVDLFMGPGA